MLRSAKESQQCEGTKLEDYPVQHLLDKGGQTFFNRGIISRFVKAVILAGGLGTRLSEETHLKPKPMVEVGGKPILWHILKIYSYHGINEFIVCLLRVV